MPIFPSSGGAQPDNVTLENNASNELQVKPSVITQTNNNANVTYSTNTTLTADVYANNVTIDSGVTLTTNGFNIYCTGTFTNNGTINTGATGAAGGAASTTGTSASSSYGGSGGGAGNGGAAGGNTTVSGGAAGTGSSNGGNGNTATVPSLTTSLIQSWYTNGISNYLMGAGGGGGGAAGGNGGGGIYIQATQIIAGTINTIGQNGVSPPSTGAGSGGGGGGSVLLAYGSGGYTAGTYTTTGGTGGTSNGVVYGNGGNGGNGIVMTFSGNPIVLTSFSYTTNSQSVANRNSSYQYKKQPTTSTSPVTVISNSLTPKTSGLLTIRASIQISNQTLGNGVAVYLYNETTLLDSDTYTQEGTTNNTHVSVLYYESTYTLGTPQTFSSAVNRVITITMFNL